ncbi:hypothetical protein D9M68_206390 [compost metagenome]
MPTHSEQSPSGSAGRAPATGSPCQAGNHSHSPGSELHRRHFGIAFAGSSFFMFTDEGDS